MSTQVVRQANKDEINLGEVFKIIKKFKLSIISITLIATFLAAVFAYFSPNVYQTSSTIYIKSERGAPTTDFMSMALGAKSNNVDNEIEILKSKHITSLVLEQLNLETRYYTKHNFKTVELYQNTPFVVTSTSLSENAMSSIFNIETIDENSFKLVIEPSFQSSIINYLESTLITIPENKVPIKYSKIHNYGEEILTPWFTLKIKKAYTTKNTNYSFIISSQDSIASFIQDGLSVSTISQFGTIVKLSFNDNIPRRASDILNAITSIYLSEELNYKNEGAMRTLDFLDAQIENIHKTLKTSASNLQDYKSTNQVISLESKAALSAERLASLEKELYALEMRENVFLNISTYIQNNESINGINIGATIDPTINAIILKIQENTSLKNSLLIDFTQLHPDVLKVTKNLDSLKQSLNSSVSSNLRNIKNKKRVLNKIIRKQHAQLQALPQQERELTTLKRDFMANEKIYNFLLEKRAETAIIQSSTVSETKVVDTAFIPKLPIKPKRALIVIVGFMLGMIIGISLALFRNFLDDTVKTVDDIERQTTIPFYGAVPYFNPKQKKSQAYEESLRVIRTNLEFLQNSDKSKLITITSSIPLEGKTTIITEIAKVVAKSHKTAVLLDLDMRRARVHEKYTKSNKLGMSNLLAGKNSLVEVIQHTDLQNLDVVTSGPVPANPSELIMSTKMKEITDELLTRYDYVFLDTPPIGLVTDAMMLMKISDLNLFVLRANYSKKDFIKNINRFVKEQDLSKSGIILNSIEFNKNSAYGYGYGHGYGYKNDYYKD